MDDSSKLQGLEGRIDVPVVETQSFKNRIMALKLSNVSAREWFQKTREGVKSWPEFIKTDRFKLPQSVAPVPKRIIKNIEYFQGNYMFIFLGLLIFCILTSPMLLVAIGACLGACYIISLKNADKKMSIMGREISVAQQYAAVGVGSFPLFWLAGAGSAVFWIIGASFFVIMAHATLYRPQIEDGDGFDIEMQSVETV
ncbi:hypothetical protein SNE40_016959 [Patella caerulea]|uniref:PRA1 family protein n=1 Tax=Patella caerulea TaxID=87958 RepID=A0AAN8JA87_PATCE